MSRFAAGAAASGASKAALERGLYLMTHWNVVMVVPPLTITRDEAEEGVAVLDDVLAIFWHSFFHVPWACT